MTARIPKIVVVGPSYIDTAIKCTQFPRPSQTAEGAAFSCSPTGAGPNRAVEAALCGCEVSLISKVGDDTFGQLVKDTLISQGVNTDFVYTAQAMHTGAVVTIVNSLGENMSCISPGANRALGTDELACAAAEQLISSADLCLIHADLPYEVVATAIKLSSIYKTKIILETKLPLNDLTGAGNIDLPKEFYSVNILVPDMGDRYAAADVGAGNVHKLKRIGSELVARGMESVVMKMGARGSFISDSEGTAHIPGFDIEMIDRELRKGAGEPGTDDGKIYFRDSNQTMEAMRKELTASIVGAEVTVGKQEMGPPTGAPINVEIHGNDFAVMTQISEDLQNNIRHIPGIVDLKDNYETGLPEIQVNIDKERTALLGLDVSLIGYVMKAAVQGVRIGSYREGEDEYDITARLPETQRQNIQNIMRLRIPGYAGEQVPLTSVATICR